MNNAYTAFDQFETLGYRGVAIFGPDEQAAGDGAGKRPCSGAGWQTHAPETHRACLTSTAGRNVGVLCAHGTDITALDIDCDYPEIAAVLETLPVLAWLPRRYGNKPRVLFPCKIKNVSDEGTVHDLTFRHADGREFTIQIIRGQYVAWGIHPKTRKPYEWFGNLPPSADLPYIDYPEFVRQTVEAMGSLGFTTKNDRPGAYVPLPGDLTDEEKRALIETGERIAHGKAKRIDNGSDRRDTHVFAAASYWRALIDADIVTEEKARDIIDDHLAEASPNYEAQVDQGLRKGNDAAFKELCARRAFIAAAGMGFTTGAQAPNAPLTVFERMRQAGLAASTVSVSEAEAFANVLSAILAEKQRQEAKWEAPQPVSAIKPAATFNFKLLPDTLQPWCSGIATQVNASPDFIAVSAIVALGAAIGTRCTLRPLKGNVNWVETARLWGLNIAEPGSNKTPAQIAVLSPLTSIDRELKGRHTVAMQSYDIAVSLQERKEKAVGSVFSKGVASHGTAGADEDALRELMLTAPKKPPRVSFIEMDTSPVSLTKILEDNPYGVMVLQDEMPTFLRRCDPILYPDARNLYLKGWNGTGSYSYSSIAQGHVYIAHLSLGLLGSAQPGALSPLIREAIEGGAGADGMMQRFSLIAWPDDQYREPPTPAFVESHAVEWAEQYKHALRVFRLLTCFSMPAQADSSPPFLNFTPEASARFHEWHRAHGRRPREGLAMQAHLAKYPTLVCGVALIIELTEWAGRAVISNPFAPKPEAVGLDALEKAIAISKWAEEHARRFYGAATGSLDATRALARRIVAGDVKNGMAVRTIKRKQWSGLGSGPEVDEALNHLQDLNWLRLVGKNRSTTGRLSQVIEVNPMIERMKIED